MSHPSLKNAHLALSAYPINSTMAKFRPLKKKTAKKAVWEIRTNKGTYILKKVPLDKDRIQFMAHAIDYLRTNGVKTPQVIRTKTGEVFTNVHDEYYIVFEAVHGRSPDYKKKHDLKKIMEGIGHFHKGSSGFTSPIGYYPSFLLDERKSNYKKRYKRLLKLKKNRSESVSINEFDRLFLKNVDTFLNQCESSLSLFDSESYDTWAEIIHKNINLCHQDYAENNLLITPDSDLYVFDMDSLTVDLPIRDIRKILNKVMRKEAEWNLDIMLRMLKDYQRVNPLSKEQYEILGAELMFPHLFYDQATTYYYKRQNNWSEEKHVMKLKNVISTEMSKDKVLPAFLQRMNEVID